MLQMSKPLQSASPHLPHSVYTKDCINPHCTFYPSATPHTFISPSFHLTFIPSHLHSISPSFHLTFIPSHLHSISPSFHLTFIRWARSSPGYGDSQPSSPMFQSHMSIHSGHKPCISFPLWGMMHPDLSG